MKNYKLIPPVKPSKFKKAQRKFDKAARITAILTGFIIPLSVSGIGILINAASILSVVAGQWKKKFNFLKKNAVLYIALLLFLLFVLTIPFSSAPAADILEYLWKYGKLLYLFFLMPLFFSKTQKQYGINAFLWGMIVTLFAALFSKIGFIHMGKPYEQDMLFTNHINTGLLMAFAGFIILHRCFTESRWRWEYRILFIAIVVFLFFVNNSRTGYIIFFALLILFLWQKFSWRGILTSLIIVPLFVTGLYFISNSFRLHVNIIFSYDLPSYQQRQLEYNSTGLRWEFAKHSLQLIKQHRVVGNGVGSFRSEYRKHFPADPGFANMAHPQNEYLLITEQLGLVGLAVFIALLIAEWLASLRLPSELKNYAQGFLVAFIIGCACDSFLFIMIPGYFFVYFSALFFSGFGNAITQEKT